MKRQMKKQDAPVSLYPLKLGEALGLLMNFKPPDKTLGGIRKPQKTKVDVENTTKKSNKKKREAL